MYDFLGSVTPPGNAEGESALSWFSLGIPFAIFSLIALLPGWVIEEDWWLKAQSARSTRAARQGIWANLAYNIIWILALPSIIGILGLVLYPPAQFDAVDGRRRVPAHAALPRRVRADGAAADRLLPHGGARHRHRRHVHQRLGPQHQLRRAAAAGLSSPRVERFPGRPGPAASPRSGSSSPRSA